MGSTSASDVHTLASVEPAYEEEEEEVEPPLLYHRLGGDAASLLSSHAVTAVALHGHTYIAVGVRSGELFLFDAEGKEVRCFVNELHFASLPCDTHAQLRRFVAHRSEINDVGFDAAGAFVGAASEDGSLSVSSVAGEERSLHEYGSPVKARRWL